jgi:hypothetical protein
MTRRVLFITPRYSEKSTSGGLSVTLERVRGLRQHMAVTVLTVGEAGQEGYAVTTDGVTIWRAGYLKPRTLLGLLASYRARIGAAVFSASSSAVGLGVLRPLVTVAIGSVGAR